MTSRLGLLTGLSLLCLAGQSLLAQAAPKKITREDAVAEKRDFTRQPNVALVVGVSAYPRESGLNPLTYAASDAEEIAKTLREQGYQVRLLQNEQALRGSVRRALTELGKAVETNQGTFLFYFSGHGFAYDKVNYLATYGTTIDDLKSEGLPLPEVEKLLKASGAKRQLMFVDACRNEPTVGGKTVSTPSFTADLRERLARSEGLRILYSTKAGTVSYENSELRQGVFTHFLLRGLRGEASGYSRDDRQSDQLLTFADVSSFVIDKMRAYGVERGQVQIPYEAGESSGDFLLAAKLLPPEPPRPPAAPSAPATSTASIPPQAVPPPAAQTPPRPTPTQTAAAIPNGGIGELASSKDVLGSLPQVWRNLGTNRLYTIRFDNSHMYISERPSNNVIADLVLKTDPKKATQKYEGNSRLTNCPGGVGWMEVTAWNATRIEAKAEVLPPKVGTTPPQCGGVFGKLRTMTSAAFIPEGK